MESVKKLSNAGKSLQFMIVYGCNVGGSDNGIAQSLANQLGITVRASTTGQDFSARNDQLTGGNGKHPNTGPTYMVSVGNGTWRDFSRKP